MKFYLLSLITFLGVSCKKSNVKLYSIPDIHASILVATDFMEITEKTYDDLNEEREEI